LARIGSGLDIHVFAEGVPLWLGGVLIPHHRGLSGHSDGDVASHALIDALLGATTRGDIGDWFPSSDERWRDARGTDLVRTVWSSLAAEGWRIENVDLTIVTSAPRLAPSRDQMREALAAALDTPIDTVSIKFTTADGLGALGRAEGILAQAVVLLDR
jgi:2-C-methyl-D-erythritol 2,4-cyclodiphosphate synthase